VGTPEAVQTLGDVIRSSGLVDPGVEVVVLVSGGPDSACAAAGLVQYLGPNRVHALHVNYGLREAADGDERVVRDLCAQLRLDLHVERPRPGALEQGNLQAAARRARYAAAERLRVRAGAQWIATGHTRSDVAETVLYRLAASPGTRALMGLAPRFGRVVRPLLDLSRSETRALAASGGLPFADDESNDDPAFARNRVRSQVMPALSELSAHAERNIFETRAELAEEAGLLERVAFRALEAAGSPAGATSVPAAALAGWDPALRRIALRTLAERAAGRQVALGRTRTAEISRLAALPEGGEVQLGGGVSAICESGMVTFGVEAIDAAPVPDSVALTLPGRCRMGEWELRAELRDAPVHPAGPDLATLDATALGGPLEVRTWRAGDRIRPLGMRGSKTLGDLFTDRHIPRSQRSRLPIVLAGGRVAWVPGVAVAEEFRLGPASSAAAILTATHC
jgi:tRNA(Ile)-lysidine synthase